MKPVGGGSALDDYFDLFPEEDRARQQPSPPHQRGDSGGSENNTKKQSGPSITVEEIA